MKTTTKALQQYYIINSKLGHHHCNNVWNKVQNRVHHRLKLAFFKVRIHFNMNVVERLEYVYTKTLLKWEESFFCTSTSCPYFFFMHPSTGYVMYIATKTNESQETKKPQNIVFRLCTYQNNKIYRYRDSCSW